MSQLYLLHKPYRVLSQFTEAEDFEIELSDGSVKSISADELSALLGE